MLLKSATINSFYTTFSDVLGNELKVAQTAEINSFYSNIYSLERNCFLQE